MLALRPRWGVIVGLLLVVCAVTIWVAGSGGCVSGTLVQHAIEVDIRDSMTGAPLAEQAHGWVKDGDYTEVLHPAGWVGGPPPSGVMVSRRAGEERPGTYEVTVVHQGYAPWSTKEVKVVRNCRHVGTVRLEARLRRLP